MVLIKTEDLDLETARLANRLEAVIQHDRLYVCLRALALVAAGTLTCAGNPEGALENFIAGLIDKFNAITQTCTCEEDGN
jgi:hypothetical protein